MEDSRSPHLLDCPTVTFNRNLIVTGSLYSLDWAHNYQPTEPIPDRYSIHFDPFDFSFVTLFQIIVIRFPRVKRVEVGG